MASKHRDDASASHVPHSRREFLRKAAQTAGGLIALSSPLVSGPWLSSAAAADTKRSYVAGRFALELDGQFAGFVTGFEGGNLVGQVISLKVADGSVRKQIGGMKIEPISIETGLSMEKPFYEWIKAILDGKAGPKNGAIIAMDFNNKEVGRRIFFNALITEIEFPACDAASKEAARMTITLTPESLRFDPPSLKQAPLPVTKQKQWLPSNFRLNIQGLEPATARVNKVEALVIKQKVTEEAVGQRRDIQKGPSPPEYPNLVITLPESQAGLFYAWHQDFVIKGNNGQDKEKPGVLEILSPDLKSVLASLQFQNLGIFKVAPEPGQAGAEAIGRIKAEMYCEKITATFNA